MDKKAIYRHLNEGKDEKTPYLCGLFNTIITESMNNSIKPNSFQAWLLAMRPKTLTGAAIPVLLGCALAYIFGKFQPVPALLCFLFAFLMQTDANFINDLYDYLKGTDREDRLGPERACAQGWITPAGMKRGIAVTTLLACCVGLGLLSYGGWEMIPVGLACVIFAFLYTAGPYPLAYHGWGDVLVLIFFGFVPVGCTFYVMAHSWNTAVFVVSLACGLIIDTLLMVNTSATGSRMQSAESEHSWSASGHARGCCCIFCSEWPHAGSASTLSGWEKFMRSCFPSSI